MLYACKTGCLTRTRHKKLDVMERLTWTGMGTIIWTDDVTNEDVLEC